MRARVSSKIGLAVGVLVLTTLLVQVTLTRLFMEREVDYFREQSVHNGLHLLSIAVRDAKAIDPTMLREVEEGPALGVYDASGHPLARTENALRVLPPPVMARALSVKEPVVTEGEPQLCILAVRVAQSSGTVVRFVAFDVGYIERRLWSTRLRVLASITLASMLLALLATLWLTRRIRRRLLAASQVVKRVAAGELDVRLPVASDDEVGRLASDFNRMAERLMINIQELRDESARRRRIFADWTHEIATPLSSVLGYLEALQNEELSAERRARYLLRAHEQAHALESLADDLTVLSQLESEGLTLDKSPRSLPTLLRAEAEASALRVPALSRSIELPDAAMCPVDAPRLSQVLRNVLANAERHARSRISVRCEPKRGGHEICIEDDGEGIHAAHLALVTESFYRADGSRDRGTGGRGLGLSIARRIMEAHGGQLTVESEFGIGTCVRLWLPGGD